MIAPARIVLLATSGAGLLVVLAVAAPPGGPVRVVLSPVDSAAVELEAGRPWHAALVLLRAHPDGAGLDPDGVLVLARAEAGALRWDAVRERLEGEPWLGELGGGEGWGLLARALEEAGRWGPAADAYERYLALPHGREAADRPAVVARRTRALARERAWPSALAQLDVLHEAFPALAERLALELGGAGALAGEVAEVRALVATISDPALRARAWDLEPRARLAAGDTAAAETALAAAVVSLEGARRGEAWLLLGDVQRARGEAEEARSAFRGALASGLPAAPAARAARVLLELGGLDAPTALEAARALDRVGDAEPALRAYDLYARLLAPPPPAPARLARARLMAQVPARHEEAAAELRALSELPEGDVASVALDQWARLRDRQGRATDAETLRDRLVARFPASAEAASVMFLRGDAAHDRGELVEAVGAYRRLVEAAPARDQAGLARMRWAQIHRLRGEADEAAGVFEGYLEDFPTGRRWEEATYWAARTRLELGDSARALALLSDLRTREPFGYYAILGEQLLGRPFRIDVPDGEAPPLADWMAEGLRTVDLLDAAGLRDAARETVLALRSASSASPPAEGLRLAEELIRRGHSLEGINLGWALRERGMPWSRRLLEVVYPFPARERIQREAREWEVDPLLVAALVRQESAWEEGIRSSAGAVGLMQVMPETGRELFTRHGGGGEFRPGLLEVGDLNLHLGTAFLVELLARYGGDLPLALSGYNAGPHRADRWKAFPEASDPLQFTERIPFAETRDYVKRVYRNRVLYEALHGDGRRG